MPFKGWSKVETSPVEVEPGALSKLAGQTDQLDNGMGHFEGIVPQNFQT